MRPNAVAKFCSQLRLRIVVNTVVTIGISNRLGPSDRSVSKVSRVLNLSGYEKEMRRTSGIPGVWQITV